MFTYPLHAKLEVQASRGSVILASSSGKLGPSGAWQARAGARAAELEREQPRRRYCRCISVAAEYVGSQAAHSKARRHSKERASKGFKGTGFKGRRSSCGNTPLAITDFEKSNHRVARTRVSAELRRAKSSLVSWHASGIDAGTCI